MKKIIAMLLAVIMVLGLAACGSKPAETTEAPKATQGSSVNQPTETPDWKEEHPTWLCEEKTTLVIHTHDSDGAGIPIPSNDQGFWKALEEYTNVHIEWNLVPAGDYSTVLSSRMAAGEYMGDIVRTGGSSDAHDGGLNGLFVEMTDLFNNYMPHTQKWLAENNCDMSKYWLNADGTMYNISSIANATENHQIIIWNTEWLKKIGKEVPDTVDEVYEVLAAMKAAGDLNGNGQADEIYLSAHNWTQLLSADVLPAMFGLEKWSGWSADENGKVFFTDTTENFKAYVKYANQLWEEGLIDQELFSVSWDWDRITALVTQDRVGAICTWSSFAPELGALTPAGAQDPMGEYFSISKAVKSEWNNNQPEIVCDWGYFYGYAISTECKNPELAAAWMDVVMADPYVLDLRVWGEEGTHYVVDETGARVKLTDESGAFIPTQSDEWGGGQIAVAHIQTADMINSIYPQWYSDTYAEFFNGCTPIESTITGNFSDEEEELYNTYIDDFMTYTDEMVVKFITGELDIDAEWETYVATCEALGLEELTAVHQSLYDRVNG